MQIMLGRNLTDRLHVAAETSIFTTATVICVRMGEALRDISRWREGASRRCRSLRSLQAEPRRVHVREPR